MAKCTCIYLILTIFIFDLVLTDDRINYNSENEKRWNTPPELTPEAFSTNNKNQDSSEPRFLPFSASFTLNSGTSNSHSLSIGGTNDGISLSQSQSMGSSSFGNIGSDLSASQSSSFSAGLSGISASNSNAFNLNHPLFGGNSNVNTNSFSLGQATSSANGKINNNKAITSAQSSVGSWNSLASSGASSSVNNNNQQIIGSQFHGHNERRGKPFWTNINPNYNIGGVYQKPVENSGRGGHYGGFNTRPLRLDIDVDDSQYQKNHPTVLISDYQPSSIRNHEIYINEHEKKIQRQPKQESRPSLQVSTASASASSSSTSQNGFSIGQSSSHSGFGRDGPTSWTQNYGQTSGNAQSHSQGTSATVGQNFDGKTQASFSSGLLASNSFGNGHSQGLSISGNRGQKSHGQVNHQTSGLANIQGSANSGSVLKFPDEQYQSQNIQREFIRSRTKSSSKNPIDEFFTDITDTVEDLFDF